MTKILLAFASLSFLWVCCGPINAQSKRLEPEAGQLPREVIGVGKTEEEAKARALKEAIERVKTLMAMQKPPLESFAITEKYVREQLVGPGSAGDDLKNEALDKPLKQWVLPFRTDHDWWNDIVRRDRAEQRHTWTARVMLGLTVLLVGGFGYVRLDEYTQRRYTTWLRIAGIGVATSVAAGWWYVFQGSW